MLSIWRLILKWFSATVNDIQVSKKASANDISHLDKTSGDNTVNPIDNAVQILGIEENNNPPKRNDQEAAIISEEDEGHPEPPELISLQEMEFAQKTTSNVNSTPVTPTYQDHRSTSIKTESSYVVFH